MELIRKCPNCGGEDIYVRHTNTSRCWVLCGDCNSAGNIGNSEEEAINHWNTVLNNIAYENKLIECFWSGNFDFMTVKELREHVKELIEL